MAVLVLQTLDIIDRICNDDAPAFALVCILTFSDGEVKW